MTTDRDDDAPTEDEILSERDLKLLRLKRRGETFDTIGKTLNVSRQYAHKRYWQLVRRHVAVEVDAHRAEQLDRLDALRRLANEVVDKKHLVVSHGKVVRIGEPVIDESGKAVIREGHGEALLDDTPRLQASRLLLEIEKQEAALLGLNAPVKTDVNGGVEFKVSIVGVDVGAMR